MREGGYVFSRRSRRLRSQAWRTLFAGIRLTAMTFGLGSSEMTLNVPSPAVVISLLSPMTGDA